MKDTESYASLRLKQRIKNNPCYYGHQWAKHEFVPEAAMLIQVCKRCKEARRI